MVVYDKTMLARRMDVARTQKAGGRIGVRCACGLCHLMLSCETRKIYCQCGLRILIDPKG